MKKELEELVVKAKQGDNDAFGKLFELTQEKAYYTAIKFVKNEDDAMDILQDSYIRAFKSLDKLKDDSRFESWLNCTVANLSKNFLIKKKPTAFSDMTDEDDDFDFQDSLENADVSLVPHDVADNNETKRLVMQCIDSLSDDQRACVIMFYFDELSIAEIAEALEISEGTVKSRLNRARKLLKVEFEDLEKKGTKLYGIPFPMLLRWALFSDSKAISATVSTIAVKTAVVAAVTATTGATVAATTGVAVTGVATGKIIAIVLSAVVVVGVVTGGLLYNNQVKEKEKAVVETTVSTTVETTKPEPKYVSDYSKNTNIRSASVAMYNEYMYYAQNHAIMRKNMITNEAEKVYDVDALSFIIFDEFLFVNNQGYLEKINLKTNKISRLCDDMLLVSSDSSSYDSFYLWNDCIYFRTGEDSVGETTNVMKYDVKNDKLTTLRSFVNIDYNYDGEPYSLKLDYNCAYTTLSFKQGQDNSPMKTLYDGNNNVIEKIEIGFDSLAGDELYHDYKYILETKYDNPEDPPKYIVTNNETNEEIELDPEQIADSSNIIIIDDVLYYSKFNYHNQAENTFEENFKTIDLK